MFFKTRKELQSLVNTSRKSLAEAEEKITERNKLLEYQHQKINKLKEENLAVHEENKDLRFENEELKDTLKEINMLLTSNTYNDKEILDRKIKELVQTAIQN